MGCYYDPYGVWERAPFCGPEGPADGPKGLHASEASDEPRSGEEPVPEATP